MGHVYMLDCTLRDGGYVNNWRFGQDVIRDIMRKLVVSNIDFIECGYYSQTKLRSNDYTIYNSLEYLLQILPDNSSKSSYAVMINFGECSLEGIPNATSSMPIIRVCFHKDKQTDALFFCQGLKEKGYKVFVQPMAVMNYNDIEFLQLIQKANQFSPDGFYIVDSFGALELRDFQRLLALADRNLDESILLGYHSHNNLQQAYENAKFMVEQNLVHDIILDASLYGMGRGAGNLNMELFADYLNREHKKNYVIEPLLEIIDEYLMPIFSRYYWGYSLPYYLSAKHNCHPNYAGYFSEKNTLSNKSMDKLLASILPEDKAKYSEKTAEKYYQQFQRNYIDDRDNLQTFSEYLSGKEILILAPGKSIKTYSDQILDYLKKTKPVVIGINEIAPEYHYDFLMCVNEKRFSRLGETDNITLLLTSNLRERNEGEIVFNYSSYLVDDQFIADNPVLMLLKILHIIGKNEVSIAGFDGYGPLAEDNYFREGISLGSSIDVKLKKNIAISAELQKMLKYIQINFLTPSLYLTDIIEKRQKGGNSEKE